MQGSTQSTSNNASADRVASSSLSESVEIDYWKVVLGCCLDPQNGSSCGSNTRLSCNCRNDLRECVPGSRVREYVSKLTRKDSSSRTLSVCASLGGVHFGGFRQVVGSSPVLRASELCSRSRRLSQISQS